MEVFIQIFKKNWITIFFSIALLSAAIMLGNKNSEIETLQNEVSYLEDQILTLVPSDLIVSSYYTLCNSFPRAKNVYRNQCSNATNFTIL